MIDMLELESLLYNLNGGHVSKDDLLHPDEFYSKLYAGIERGCGSVASKFKKCVTIKEIIE